MPKMGRLVGFVWFSTPLSTNALSFSADPNSNQLTPFRSCLVVDANREDRFGIFVWLLNCSSSILYGEPWWELHTLRAIFNDMAQAVEVWRLIGGCMPAMKAVCG